jgi:hypothetical protein
MNEQHVARDNFIRAYDECADNIFAYCYKKTAERDVAKYLTRNIFRTAWDAVTASGQSIESMKRVIWEQTRESVRSFLAIRDTNMRISNNLWNLTLSQQG